MRLITRAVDIIRQGGVIVYPTDTAYALGCHLGDKKALETICRIRRLDVKHHFTLICRDLSDAGTYATFDTPVYRLLKAATPGAYTFLLTAQRSVPRRLLHPRKKTIGLRIPDHRITQTLLDALGEPMLTTTLIMPGEALPLQDAEEIRQRLNGAGCDLIIDGGRGGTDVTTMVDMTSGFPEVIREGKGDTSIFL
ncbi:threonylcarbamoyl-AMP synthase [bacterium]|nr:threonylcarbamoyl-AMP synthase [bacterium]